MIGDIIKIDNEFSIKIIEKGIQKCVYEVYQNNVFVAKNYMYREPFIKYPFDILGIKKEDLFIPKK